MSAPLRRATRGCAGHATAEIYKHGSIVLTCGDCRRWIAWDPKLRRSFEPETGRFHCCCSTGPPRGV